MNKTKDDPSSVTTQILTLAAGQDKVAAEELKAKYNALKRKASGFSSTTDMSVIRSMASLAKCTQDFQTSLNCLEMVSHILFFLLPKIPYSEIFISVD